MKKIKLTKGKYALIDDEDLEKINKHRWALHSGGYAVCDSKYMHRFIMDTPKGLYVDHINHKNLIIEKRI